MIYEYLIISRNYSLSILVLLIYLIFFRKRGILIKSVILGLLANTHFFAAIVAGVLLLHDVNPKITHIFSLNRKKIIAYVVFSCFIILLFLQLKNSLGHAVLEQYNSWTFFERCKRLVALHFRSFLVIPDFSSIHFWGSSLPFRISKAFGLLAIPIFLFPLWFFRERKIKWLYYTAIVMISVFLFSIHQPIASRYACFIFIIFITFYWLQEQDSSRKSDNSTKLHTQILTVILSIQMISGIVSIYYDYKYPFSQGKNVAEYIAQNGYSNWPLIIHPYSSAPSVSLYLGKPYFSLLTQDNASFCRWETNPFMISNEEFFDRLTRYMIDNKKEVLLVKNTYTKNDKQKEKEIVKNGYYENDFIEIKAIQAFEPAVVSNEGFLVYVVKYKRSAIEKY